MNKLLFKLKIQLILSQIDQPCMYDMIKQITLDIPISLNISVAFQYNVKIDFKDSF